MVSVVSPCFCCCRVCYELSQYCLEQWSDVYIRNDETLIRQGGTEIGNKEVLVVASKVKAYIKNKNMMTSSDAITTLSDKVCAILDKAAARAKANKRSTVKPQDL